MSRGRSLLKWSVILFIVSLIALWFIVPLFPGVKLARSALLCGKRCSGRSLCRSWDLPQGWW